MPQHPALGNGRVAVITGAASGIGLAAAKRFAALGMNLVLADLEPDALESGRQGRRRASGRPDRRQQVSEVLRPRTAPMPRIGDVTILMNNAGASPGGGRFDRPDAGSTCWRSISGASSMACRRSPRR